ncbi:MAG: hypothetical protein ABIN92_08575 [Ferruginibacter sp.]
MRPLSPKMEEVLMDLHERDILKQEPLSTYYSKFCKGLLERGLICARPAIIEGKFIMAFFITNLGLNYLDNTMSI